MIDQRKRNSPANKYTDVNYAAAAAQIPWGHNMIFCWTDLKL